MVELSYLLLFVAGRMLNSTTDSVKSCYRVILRVWGKVVRSSGPNQGGPVESLKSAHMVPHVASRRVRFIPFHCYHLTRVALGRLTQFLVFGIRRR